jgi:hypothetical protein
VTIGYDAPWRQVHELLIAAVGGTKQIRPSPGPFVLPRALDDFCVRYEINAYTDAPTGDGSGLLRSASEYPGWL